MHHSAVCIMYAGHTKVYSDDITKKACEGYHNRNTGDEKSDECPDCEMVRWVGSLILVQFKLDPLTLALDLPWKYERLSL